MHVQTCVELYYGVYALPIYETFEHNPSPRMFDAKTVNVT